MKTVNVIESYQGLIQSLKAFPDNAEGNKQAEALFRANALENGATEESVDADIEDGVFARDGYILTLIHSS